MTNNTDTTAPIKVDLVELAIAQGLRALAMNPKDYDIVGIHNYIRDNIEPGAEAIDLRPIAPLFKVA